MERDALIAQLDLIASRLPDKYGGSPTYREIIERFTPRVVSLEEFLGTLATPLWILLGATGILLVIACANVANLFLARTERQRARRRDPSRDRRATLEPRRTTAPRDDDRRVARRRARHRRGRSSAADDRCADPRLGAAVEQRRAFGDDDAVHFGVSIVAGLLCGIVPAVRTAGVSLTWLRDRSRGATRARHWTRDGLVVGQAALALVLLFGSGLLLRSFAELRNVDPGYAVEDIFTFQMAPEQAQLRDGPSWASFHLAFMERLRALPGVETVGIVENFPLNEGIAHLGFTLEPAPPDAAEHLLRFDDGRRRLLRSDGSSAAARPDLHGSRAARQPGPRHRLAVDGRAPVARRGPARQATDVQPVRLQGDRDRRGRGRPPERFPRRNGTERLLPAGRAEPRGLGDEHAGLRVEERPRRQHRG